MVDFPTADNLRSRFLDESVAERAVGELLRSVYRRKFIRLYGVKISLSKTITLKYFLRTYGIQTSKIKPLSAHPAFPFPGSE
jgi:hypothetical protein